MPAVKFFARLDLDQICLFLDGHQLTFELTRLSTLGCCRSLFYRGVEPPGPKTLITTTR